MSSFGGQNNWMNTLGGLFGTQNQQPQRGGQFAQTGYTNWMGLPVPQSDLVNRIGTPNNPTFLQQNTTFSDGSNQGGMTWGQALMGALGKDYQNREAARQQELGMYQGLLGNVLGGMQGAGQMVGDARNLAQQNMAGFNQQANALRQAAGQGQRWAEQANQQLQGAVTGAQRQYDQSIATMQQAKKDFDAGWMGDAASSRLGLAQDYKNQMDGIERQAQNGQLTADQAQMMKDSLNSQKAQQAAVIQNNATSKARDTLLAIDQNISQLQASGALGIGQMALGAAQAGASLGMQAAGMQQQAEEQIGSFYNNMAQFNSSLMQNAQAQALQYTLNGNQLAASLIAASPFGHTSFFDTIAKMVEAGGMNRNSAINQQMANLLGSLS
jgi:hypothetical protein